MSILERLEQMERRMAEMTGVQQHKPGSGSGGGGGGTGSGTAGSQAQCASAPGPLGSCFESRVVVVCEKMMSRACWAKSKHLIHAKTFRGMTLLHLAAAQGYATLIQTLIKWRTKHADSIDLELEVDPLNVDHFSCTPLMWACALGHLEAAVVLYKWDRRAISIPDSLGRLPLGIARSRGHVRLAECLEHLQRDEQAPLGPHPRVRSPPGEEPAPDSWVSQWHSDTITSPEMPKGATVIASTNPAQVAGSAKGTSVGKEAAPAPLRQREPMSVLMMAGREVKTEPGTCRESAQSEGEACAQPMDDIQVNMITLAERIIEAAPERIKQESFVALEPTGAEREGTAIGSTMSWLASYLADVDHLPGTAHISLSPMGSPARDVAFDKPSLPSAADWSEFLSASSSDKVENEFAQLTLSDHEQRELYEAARLVQTAFRKYKGRPLREQQEVAAAVIQRCYRKYKQYALYKKMTQAAILIQSKFRSYYEQKRFQQSRRAAVLIQKFYRSYKKCGRRRQARRTAVIVQQKLRSSLLTKKQDQAARKIMRFLRRCRHRAKELKKAKELEDRQQHPLAM